MPNQSIVTLKNVSFSRHGRDIFNGIDLQVERGKITAILGPSGSGKTTLLKLIGAELYPDTGTVVVEQQNIHALSKKALYQMRKKMGVLFQSGALFTNLSVFENVAFPLREHTNLTERFIRDIVLMKLEAVGLRGAYNLMPAQLSGGMARRVAFARAIALDPMLMMYDEPFTGQDPISMGVLLNLIKKLNETLGTTSIIVSHDVEETLSIADRVYLINQGKVQASGTPIDLKQTNDPAVKQFIEGRADGVVPFHYPAMNYIEDLIDV